VRSDDDEIVIEPRTSTVLAGLQKPGFALGDLAHFPHAIDGVAHFSYFLGCANEADQLQGVELEMHLLHAGPAGWEYDQGRRGAAHVGGWRPVRFHDPQ
jgi:hypothetical protein